MTVFHRSNRFALIMLCLAMLLACALLCGCGSQATPEPTEVPATPTPTREPTQAPVMIALGDPTPSPTVVPTPSPTPSPTPTPEPTPVPTATPEPEWLPTDTPTEDGLYKVVVYFGTQSAVAYEAKDGRWMPIRTMACSSGKKTPTGTYKLGTKYEYHKLYGACGQYCCRITGHFLFHSVPIDENARKIEVGRQRMELDEYDKLGTPASDGCIRLCCADAKWIYDHCDKTTVVVLTKASGPNPPELPKLIREEPYMTKTGLGWDPTDPDPENPYLALYGAYLSPEETAAAEAVAACSDAPLDEGENTVLVDDGVIEMDDGFVEVEIDDDDEDDEEDEEDA